MRRFRHRKTVQEDCRQVYELFSDYTMVPRQAYINNLLLAGSVRDVHGCVVECGVWRGGMSAGLGKILGSDRDYFLFDSFEGLPPAKDIDGEAARKWQQDRDSSNYYDNCAAPPEFARQAMTLAGIPSYFLVKGWFQATLPGFVPPAPIAFLRLDGDWYDSTMICLEVLFDQVAPGGIILLDDYYTWDGCSRALHDFLSRRSAVERIDNYDGVCYLRKK